MATITDNKRQEFRWAIDKILQKSATIDNLLKVVENARPKRLLVFMNYASVSMYPLLHGNLRDSKDRNGIRNRSQMAMRNQSEL